MTRPEPDPVARRAVLGGALLALLIAVVVLLWAKWWPYAGRIGTLMGSHEWSGSSILEAGDVRPGDPPSLHAAWSFSTAYVGAVWKALVAALLISAAVQALLPRAWLLRALDRPGRIPAATVGGLVSTPSMMCTCCTAPVAATLRRSGAPVAGVVAYWLGNPLLNPAVLVFLALVAPWQWTVTRLVVGLLLVVLGAALVARLAEPRPGTVVQVEVGAEEDDTRPAWRRFLRTLGKLLVTLVPEYLVVVALVGALRGWLFPFGPGRIGTGAAVVLLAAVIGTLLVIPTGGEIPILQGLALAGLSLGGIGALLVTLPAVSLPGMAMVGRALGWRVTAATAAVVALGGLLGGVLLTALA